MITGITGQDGAFLAEILLSKGYRVIGLKRRTSTINTSRIDHLYNNTNFHLRYWDSDDAMATVRLLDEYCPNEFYNLSAQSHVQVSFEIPENTFNTVAISTLRILEAIKLCRNKIKFYQASSSEMYGSSPPPQNEKTPFNPQSPYACAKVAAFYLTKNYREAHNIFAVNGILFNHEGPTRGETFVSRKITLGVANIKKEKQDCIFLGNLYSKRDWGYAKDYMEAAHSMMQQEEPDDYVIATGETHTVKEFCDLAFSSAGMPITWSGTGINETAIDDKGRVVVRISRKYFRPTEVDYLLGDSSKARKVLNWSPKVSFEELVKIMVESDLR